MDGGAWRATVHGVAKSWTQWNGLAHTQGACRPALKGDGSEQEDRQEQADHWQARPVAQGGRH